MKKNVYQKPTMKTVHLHQRAKLLAGSGESLGMDSRRSIYEETEAETWN
jgi:hypothetical protein